MLLLTRIRPDLDGGIFTYAREGFGEIGFCSRYWLCAVIANVSYLVSAVSSGLRDRWPPSPSFCRWAPLSHSPPPFQLDTFRLDFSGRRWACRWEQVKTPC